MKTVVEICNFNDRKLVDALKGLALQTKQPDTVLVADGGSEVGYVREMTDYIHADPAISKLNIIWMELRGTPAETRQKSIQYLDAEVTAFLDSDEVPYANWLEEITKPIMEGRADFVGGPMKSVADKQDFIASYYIEIENRIYNSDVAIEVTYMPLGNTAWKTEILKRLGFDARIAKSYGEAEDYDLEMRAIDNGYRGLYVPGALVRHYQNFPLTYWDLMRKRYQYLLGAAVVMVKNKRLGRRITEKRSRIRHPFGKVEALMKPLALVHGYLKWHLVVSRRPSA